MTIPDTTVQLALTDISAVLGFSSATSYSGGVRRLASLSVPDVDKTVTELRMRQSHSARHCLFVLL